MKRLVPLMLLLLLSVSPLTARRPFITYHDDVTRLADTVVTFPLDTAALSIVLEARGSFVGRSASLARDTRSWSVVWGSYPADYYAATLSTPLEPDPDYIVPSAFTLDITRCRQGAPVASLASAQLEADSRSATPVTLEIIIDPISGTTDLYAGTAKLIKAASLPLDYHGGIPLWGIGARGILAVATALAQVTPDPARDIACPFTAATLDAYLASSADPLEGYWDYLDRENDPSLARPGGSYTLALVRTPDRGYDIIYVSGASVMASRWATGMCRGHLTPTIFRGHYDLSWVDASFEPVESRDLSAQIEQGAILILSFPEYGTRMRFSRRAHQR